MEKTSIEWLFEKLWDEPKDKLTWHSIFEQAKEIHKQQIEDAYHYGYSDAIQSEPKQYEPEKYYLKTFEKEMSAEAKRRAANYMNLKQK